MAGGGGGSGALGPALLGGGRRRRARHPRRHRQEQPRRHVRAGLQPQEQRGLSGAGAAAATGGGGGDLRPERGGHRDADRDAGGGDATAHRAERRPGRGGAPARRARRQPHPLRPPLQNRLRARGTPPAPPPPPDVLALHRRRRRRGRRGVRRRHARARRRGPGVILLIHHLNPQPAAAVPGREEVGAVHLVVTYQAKKRGVSGAVHRGHAPAQLAPGATTAALAVADLHYRLQEAGLLCHSVEHLAGVCVALYYRAKQGDQSPREGEMAMATGGRKRGRGALRGNRRRAGETAGARADGEGGGLVGSETMWIGMSRECEGSVACI